MDAPAGRAGPVVARGLFIVAMVVLLRLPFLNQAIQGDDPYYLYGAEHAQIDPLHPTHARYLFQGDLVDMRGHSHGPLNSWILAAPLAVLGDVREAPFHVLYILWSVIAALAVWSLARRFCDKPFFATLLFLAVPAFVVNGNSLEADLPFLAFWMSAIALFVGAVEEQSRLKLVLSAGAAALAALDAYQAVFLTPVLASYLFHVPRAGPRSALFRAACCATLAAPLTIAAWQFCERSASGALPASVLAGYMQTYGWQALAQKTRSAIALLVHSGWIISPLVVLAAFSRGIDNWKQPRWRWMLAAAAAAAAAFHDSNPLFWASLGCGVLVLASCFRRGFLEEWVLIFFAGAILVFFAGSARYLLPIAAPVAILAARSASGPILAAGFALQMTLSLGLAIVNYQHWGGYRQFAAALSTQSQQHRIWSNAEWGLRYYLESEGAVEMPQGQMLQPGEIVVSSELASLPVNAALVSISQLEIRPSIPLRIISLNGRSAFSVASQHGLLPFEISTGPIDRVRAELVMERKPELTYLDPKDPQAKSQIVTGLFPDGWMSDQATILLKRPEHPTPLRAGFFISPEAPARHVRMLVDGQLVAEETFAAPGSYMLAVPMVSTAPTLTVTLTVDKTFYAPGDRRKLGVLITGIGFR